MIDDDLIVGRFIFHAAKSININCTVTSNINEFLALLNPEITLVLIDLIMPEMDGIELLRLLAQQNCQSGIILMSGVEKRVLETAENFAHSIGLFVAGRLQKPFKIAELETMIKNFVNSSPFAFQSAVKQKQTITISENELQQALQDKQFVLHYQPKIEIATNKVIGVEALVRWQHPQKGLIYPDAFISILESLSLIDELGWIVIERGLEEIEQISSKIKNTLTISFNLSPYSLHDCSYPDKFIAKLNQYDLKPENIILEVTESGLFSELSNALDIFTRLRIKQIQLSIDDFGTGFAMMQQLENIPATEIKIDKSFIQNMLCQDSARVSVQKIIEIGKELGMKVVGEGVETLAQLQFLKDHHCDLAQGYFIAKPLAMNDFLSWVEARGEN